MRLGVPPRFDVAFGVVFMALHGITRAVQCWGEGGSCAGMDFKGVTDVYSNGAAFMALNAITGEATCWCNSCYGADGAYFSGGNCAGMDFKGVTDVYRNRVSFMALDKTTGKAQCWGYPTNGGNCAGMDFKGVTDVYSTMGNLLGDSFMALDKIAGKAQCWGNPQNGGNCIGMDFKGVTDVYSTSGAFMALNKISGKAQCWGNPKTGGNCVGKAFKGVTIVYRNDAAFMALNEVTGEAQCWGDANFGGNCTGMNFKGVTVYNTGTAFMALDRISGKAQCWGDAMNGGNCTGMDFKGVTDVYSTSGAFMALDKITGRAQCWGDSSNGGNCAGIDFKGVTNVYSTAGAFMALKRNIGKAQCWGNPNRGGNCTGMDFVGVTHVKSNLDGFVAWTTCPANSSVDGANGCVCDAGFHGSLVFSPEESMYMGQCFACSARHEYSDERGLKQCRRCPRGHFGTPSGPQPHTACDDHKCELPTLPPHAIVPANDPLLCPRSGRLAANGRNASLCYLQCEKGWHNIYGASLVPYVCSPDFASTASYKGAIKCVPDTCHAWHCKNNGTLIGGDLVHGCECSCSEGWNGTRDCSTRWCSPCQCGNGITVPGAAVGERCESCIERCQAHGEHVGGANWRSIAVISIVLCSFLASVKLVTLFAMCKAWRARRSKHQSFLELARDDADFMIWYGATLWSTPLLSCWAQNDFQQDHTTSHGMQVGKPQFKLPV